MKISFIVIARNESWKISKCFQSIYKAIKFNYLKDFEIIYVDSQSTDDTIDRVKCFANVKIFSITGVFNAAIARNIGAIESSGDLLFFIDGDMEIEPTFLSQALDINGDLKHDCIAGHLDNYMFDDNGKFIGQGPASYSKSLPKHPIELTTNGGAFLILKSTWKHINGMRTKYRRSQDYDFTIRLNQKGYKTVRLPYYIAKHNTHNFRSNRILWKNLISGKDFYPPLLFRDHILHFKLITPLLRNNYSAFIFLVFISYSLISQDINLFLLSVYLIILILRISINTIKSSSTNKIIYFFQRYILQILRDILFWIGFFAFYPKEKKISYLCLR